MRTLHILGLFGLLILAGVLAGTSAQARPAAEQGANSKQQAETRNQAPDLIIQNLKRKTQNSIFGAAEAWTVGQAGLYTAIVEHWDGARWSLFPGLGPSGVSAPAAPFGYNSDVSTIAAGVAYISPPPNCTIIGWRIYPDPVPNPLPMGAGTPLADIAGAGPDLAWAVGRDTIIRWDGAAWQPVPFVTPQATYTSVSFSAVVAGGPASAWAIGVSVPTPPAFPVALIEHWDGAHWSSLPISATSGIRRPDALTVVEADVAARGPDEAYVVESSGVAPYITGGLLRCTATQCAPLGTTTNTYFHAVAPVMGNDIWVVGSGSFGAGPAAILHWDGTRLQPVAAPDGVDFLNDVAAHAATDIWAVGSRYAESATHSVILHWDGMTWTQVPSPDIGELRRVVVLAANDVRALGPAGGLQWNGSTWDRITPALAGTVFALAGLGPHDYWALVADAQAQVSLAHYGMQPRFADVPVSSPFHPFIENLACRAVIGGYQCGGPGEPCRDPDHPPYFRPGAGVTRGQLLKIAVLSAGWALPIPTGGSRSFEDVPATDPFYSYIESGYSHGIINGYACGGPGELCGTPPRPYFRPYAGLTRGQLAKILTLARTLPQPTPATPLFQDVPTGHPFYSYIEAVAAARIVSGYSCGEPNEPCPGLYFRPAAGATRAQTAKFIANGFFPAAGAHGPGK